MSRVSRRAAAAARFRPPEPLSDRALAAVGCDLAELEGNPAAFRLATSVEHNLSEHQVVRAGTTEWSKTAQQAGLAWAWRLRVGRDVLVGGCPTRAQCEEQVKIHRRKLQELARGNFTVPYGQQRRAAK